MKLTLLIPMIVLLAAQAPAQGKVAEEIGKLLDAGEIDSAEARVKFYLKADPDNVDAIMMSGNVLLTGRPI